MFHYKTGTINNYKFSYNDAEFSLYDVTNYENTRDISFTTANYKLESASVNIQLAS